MEALWPAKLECCLSGLAETNFTDPKIEEIEIKLEKHVGVAITCTWTAGEWARLGF